MKGWSESSTFFILNMELKEIVKKYSISKDDLIYILRYKYNIDIADIITNQAINLDEKLIADDLVRINKNEPLQYIVGSVDFLGCKIMVGKGVLIPRVETEYLVDLLKKENLQNKKVLDLCCGSGAIGISIAKNYNAKVTCSDISKKALEFTRKNAQINEVNIDVLESDLFENINEKFNLIVSNPPYIPTTEILHLDENVRKYEPNIALDGGEDGLYFYRKIIEESIKYLAKNGIIYFEIGYNQADDVKKLLEKDFINVEVLTDLAKRDRIVRGRYRNV